MKPRRVPSAANTCEEPPLTIGCSDVERGGRLRDVQDVADRRDRGDASIAYREHAADDEQDPCGPAAGVPAAALSCLSRHLGRFEITAPVCDFLPAALQRGSTLGASIT